METDDGREQRQQRHGTAAIHPVLTAPSTRLNTLLLLFTCHSRSAAATRLPMHRSATRCSSSVPPHLSAPACSCQGRFDEAPCCCATDRSAACNRSEMRTVGTCRANGVTASMLCNNVEMALRRMVHSHAKGSARTRLSIQSRLRHGIAE
ncbi:hypothetical protein PSPO01_04086 [Paraphaeosphaeria sporulosa]